ncbi:hypothetical protein GPAL_2728 [Glaciecola pallidula DSM 14239 = ACAM 615]|uniref:Uncharacterized protein n=1 Tax=Brumicola pallidula DSM 14239 = ACAM 615 TaxID=1121922 RepID=K6YA05_9ALTE|nr:hypothetical protein GPAL_2728 [Glaciecola pallidula DSM 14239 = ACAM 615]
MPVGYVLEDNLVYMRLNEHYLGLTLNKLGLILLRTST